MPELPEVETITNALKKSLIQRKIIKVEVFSPKMREPLTPLLEADIEGRVIVDVRRRGRYSILELDNCGAILMHYGMSGVVRIESGEIPKRKHEHLFFHLDNGEIIRFECTRRFSLVKYCRLEKSGADPIELESLGVEPLTNEFTGEYLFEKSRRASGSIKTFVMNNEVVVGVGNIYVAESLYLAGVNPLRKPKTLTRSECDKIVENIKIILKKAIDAGGSTISDYRHVDGSEGKFARELQMYGRAGEKCIKCGSVIESCRVGGRSTFFCPNCQK